MKSSTWKALGLILVASAPARLMATPSPPGPASSSVEDDSAASSRAVLDKAYADLKAEDAISALPKLRQAIGMKGFNALSDDERRTAYASLGWSARFGGNLQEAHEAYTKATKLPESEAFEWIGRLFTARQLKDNGDSVAALTGYAQRWPRGLGRIPDLTIRTVVGWAARPSSDRERQLELLGALFDANWSSPADSSDQDWADLAVLLVEHDAINRAGAVVERIRNPAALVRLRSDRRFDQFIAAHPTLADPDGAAAAYVEALRDEARSNPRKLGCVRNLADALLLAGRWSEVVDVADSAITKADDHSGPIPFDDATDNLNWLTEDKASAQMGLGHWNDALDTMVRASHLSQGGDQNVSQVLRLGALYVSLGRATQSLETVELIDQLSDFGRMRRELVRFEARLALGERAAAANSLAILKSDEDKWPDHYLTALVWGGDLDEAERLVISRLRDPYTRSRMLLLFQHGLDKSRTAADAANLRAWRELSDRPAVAAEIAQVGRIETYKLALD